MTAVVGRRGVLARSGGARGAVGVLETWREEVSR